MLPHLPRELKLAQDKQLELENEASQLEAENNELRKGNSAGADEVQIRSLQDRMATYRKERQAIQTIMENKIKAS